MVKQRLKPNWTLLLITATVMCLLAGLVLGDPQPANASALDAEGPERKALISISYTTYEWWLLTWSDSKIVCQVYVEHEGWPEPGEVQYYCGDKILNDWLGTTPCVYDDDVTAADQCPGLYLHQASVTPGEREIEVALLPPEVYVDIADCNPQPPENRCETLPSLHLTGEEPLPNEDIISISGYVGLEPFNCEGSECTIPLPATGVAGVPVSFWAESSYGDSSDTFTAQVRVIPWGDFAAPDAQTDDPPQWYVDILSTQYLGEAESTCAQIWSSFPPVGGAPAWLTSPEHPDALVSQQPYYYLAATLIQQGQVDVSGCPDGGLQNDRVANQCGMEAARPVINEWQNQFDSEIIQVAVDTGVPSQLMKNVFSRESQFWPGFSANYNEAGLGHLSDLGADTVLLWNPSFFSQFCPLVLDTEVCQRGFGNLDLTEKEMLRGALVQKVNAACPECPLGIDLRQANFSISIFARSLLANCEQVGQIIYNTTRAPAGEVSFYEDLWRFTLVNYNAGPGCLTNAIQQAHANRAPLTWDNVIQYLEPVCQTSIDYVEDIAYMPVNQSSSANEVTQPAPTLTLTPTPTETVTPVGTPASTPQPTPTTEGYPGGYPPDYYFPTLTPQSYP
ncbi:MAG: hypothetical protein SVR81_03385 [Chloroflexota bacterium]|nr:hypothetical protein [Chloroflexota bacterium]